jgi:hypothetical protein
MAAAGLVVENGCVHEGLRFERERMAEVGLNGNFVAMPAGVVRCEEV